MTSYCLYDIGLGTACEFPELEPSKHRPGLTLEVGRLPRVPDRWEDLWSRRDGEPWVQVQRLEAGYRIRYVKQVDFEYVLPARRVSADVRACPAATFRHFFLDQVVPLILGLDTLVLHASAAVFEDRLVALIGGAGAGKSTLTAQLERRGHAAAADDGLLIRPSGDGLLGVPPYPGLRLWPDAIAMLSGIVPDKPVTAASPKRRVRAGLRLDARARRLETVLVLDDDSSAVAIEPMSARARTIALLEHSFCLERHHQPRLVDHLERVCAAGRTLQMWRVRYPRRPDCWPAVVDAIERCVGSPAARAVAAR